MTDMISPQAALAGSATPRFTISQQHHVLGNRLQPPFPSHLQVLHVALGCFWGAEKAMWSLPGVWTTAAGYMGGFTPNPSYDEVCSGRTGHAETVLVAYDPQILPTAEVVRVFFELHDPTQGFRQGNDIGTQYRSAIFGTPAQCELATGVREEFAPQLAAAGFGTITTQILPLGEAGPFYYAEAAHQQYLAKNPAGYCNLRGTGVSCPSS